MRGAALPFEISPEIDQISYLEIQKFSISGVRVKFLKNK